MATSSRLQASQQLLSTSSPIKIPIPVRLPYHAHPNSSNVWVGLQGFRAFKRPRSAMSSQILLSREVANSDKATSPNLERPAPVTSIFESSTSHFMTLGNAVSQNVSGLDSVDPETGKGKQAERTVRRCEALSHSASGIEATPFQKRKISRSSTFFDNPNDPRAALDDDLLEPCPHARICSSVSEILSGKGNTSETVHSALRRSLDMASQSSHVQPDHPIATAVSTCRPLFPAPTFPSDKRTQPNLNFEHQEYIAAKSYSPWWDAHHSQRQACQALSGAASRLPTEIIQEIYNRLSPTDFNSARHTCRSWFASSLSSKLLATMLRRLGYSDGIQDDSKPFSGSRKLSPEWIMSKRIARECALGPDVSRLACRDSAFHQISNIDFAEIAVHYPGPDLSSTTLTVSNCGRFLMAANGCLVYIYELNRSHKSGGLAAHPGLLRPVTSIICPRRVLASSMDTSSQRYAIAILLDGRMGLVCDIAALSQSSTSPSPSKDTIEEQRYFSHRDSDSSLLYYAAQGQESSWHDSFRDDIPCKYEVEGKAPEKNSEHGNASMPVENGPRSLYRNLCSEDDPPRSVAICPQRRCVAFGCSSGLELHWVDALTGQDLNRWFPLTAPSDYLFFLPPRKGVDSAKKLRLISSAGRPNERSSMSSRGFGHRSRASPFWESFGWGLGHFDEGGYDAGEGVVPGSAQGVLTRLRIDASRSSLVGRMDCSDHYRAIPLSDGYHILFTDPASGLLCLGSDAPVGGPTKLLRKIWFHCPKSHSITGLPTAESSTPVAYTAGSDLSHGVRVCAAFGTGPEQTIWLFSVPTDVFGASHTKQASSKVNWLNTSSSEPKLSEEWMNWWPEDESQQWLGNSPDSAPVILPRRAWPIKIRGQMIGTCRGLVDLTVDSGPQITVWTFNKAGVATVWKIDEGQTEVSNSLMVVRDGTVHKIESKEYHEDVEMTDAIEPLQISSQAGQLDGPASFEFSQKLPVHYDSDGDVLMADFPSQQHGTRRCGTPEQETVEAVMIDPQGSEVLYHTETWTRRLSCRDFVEELTGVARIDLEIR